MESFECDVGPVADVREFEYIVALQQTCPGYTRVSGTISSLDVLRFVKSRYAIDITRNQAIDIILGLGGGMLSSDVRKGVADIVEAKHKEQHHQRQRQQAVFGDSTGEIEGPSSPGMVLQEETAADASSPNSASKISHHERWKNDSTNRQTKKEERELMELRMEESAIVDEILNPKLIYLDMVQMVSVLLIPTLTRYVKEWRFKNHATSGNNNASGGGAGPSYQQDELERVQRRLAGNSRSAHSVSLQSDHASVEVGVSEMSNFGTSVDNASQTGGGGAIGDAGKHADAYRVLQMERLAGELSPKPDGLLEFILARMLKQIRDQTSKMNENEDEGDRVAYDPLDGESPMVTSEMVKALLLFHDEHERANDKRLVKEMVDAAQSPSGRFDGQALANALANDVSDWDVGCEDRTSTCVYDVFGDSNATDFTRIGESVNALSVATKRKNDASPVAADTGMGSYIGKGVDEDDCDEGTDAAAKGKKTDGITGDDNEEVDLEGSKRRKGAATSSLIKSRTVRPSKMVVEDEVMIKKKDGQIIDSVRDTYGSAWVVILVWLTYLCHSGTYVSLILSLPRAQYDCEQPPTVGCTLVSTIINWLILASLLTVFGIIVMLPLSFGNHPNRRSPIRLIWAIILAAIVSVLPFVILINRQKSLQEDGTIDPDGPLISDPIYRFILFIDVILGLSVASIYCVLLVISISKKYDLVKSNGLKEIISKLWVTSDEVGSTRLKHAATRKINSILANARRMHTAVAEGNEKVGAEKEDDEDDGMSKRLQDTQSDPSFQNFLLHGISHVSCGSFTWTWRRLATREIYDHDGLWFPARLWIFQFGQVVVGVIAGYILFYATWAARDSADAANAELDDQPNLPEWVYSLVPTGSQVLWALFPASIVACVVMVFVNLIYLPSTAKTILKYRCGQIPSLGSPEFNIARESVDATHMNTANAIFGMVAAAGLFYFLIGLLIFLFIWDFSRDFMILILAWGLGLTITIVLKMVITSMCRKQFYRGFYRRRPGQANLSILALECWFIGLGGGVLIGRVTQFLLASAFWIGRIDEPFLADNVSLMGYKFDYVPLNYTKEILVHEAHRHPFIERLGAMYLMRLRHKRFGSNAGGCWRQLFVLTLFPWLLKYRVSHEQRCVEAVNDQRAEVEQNKGEEGAFDDVMDVADQMIGAVDAMGDKIVNETGNVGAKIVNETGNVGAKIVHETGNVAMGGVDFVRRKSEQSP